MYQVHKSSLCWRQLRAQVCSIPYPQSGWVSLGWGKMWGWAFGLPLWCIFPALNCTTLCYILIAAQFSELSDKMHLHRCILSPFYSHGWDKTTSVLIQGCEITENSVSSKSSTYDPESRRGGRLSEVPYLLWTFLGFAPTIGTSDILGI